MNLYEPYRTRIPWNQARSRVPVHCSSAEPWIFILASRFLSSWTLYYFSGHVFNFLLLLARPDTPGFSSLLHTFPSWSPFFRNVSKCNASAFPSSLVIKILLIFFRHWASKNFFPRGNFNTQQSIPTGYAFVRLPTNPAWNSWWAGFVFYSFTLMSNQANKL